MKRLYLIRHAKSGVATSGTDDFERALAPRGRRSAPRMGRYMRDLDYKPEIALCSPAVRARQTWELLRDNLQCQMIEELRPELYLAEPRTLLDTIRMVDDRHGSAILIGHNPGIQILALGLVGRGVGTANPFGKYPTAALTVFDFEIDHWREVTVGQGILIGYTRPKELDANA